MEQEISKKSLNFGLCSALAGLSGCLAGLGLGAILSFESSIDGVRNAVYARAENITPEVIEQARQLSCKVNPDTLYAGVFSLGLASVLGVSAYILARKQD